MKKEFRSFKDARTFVQTLKIRSQTDWITYRKSGKLANDIPSTPSRTYKKEWKDWGDWLGTDRVANRNRIFLSFQNARTFVHTLKIRNHTDWITYGKSGKLHDNIPSNPNRTYKKEWKGWGDWLGTGFIASRLRKYRSFEDAREFVQSLELKNQKNWIVYSRSNKCPDDIPRNPHQVYTDKGWNSLGDWLGTGTVATFQREYHSFEEARKFAHSLGLTGANEWRAFAKSDKCPNDIPRNPNQVYKDKGWKSWGDWTGTGIIATYEIKYRGYNEAKKYSRSLGLKTANEWRTFVKSGKLPKDIPANPWKTYSQKRSKKK